MVIQELNADQRREMINSRQRFEAWRSAKRRLARTRGSVLWAESKGREYLRRSYYDGGSGSRRQTSLGPRSAETERLKEELESGRAEAKQRFSDIDRALSRQAAINRALGMGRVPSLAARLMRALDDANLMGRGIRVVGTNALYAYEAVAGVFVEAEATTTDDIDLLFDSRSTLRLAGDVPEQSLMGLLRRVDRSFERSRRTFRAVNRDGYLVDLVKPVRSPPWAKGRDKLGRDDDDLEAVMIEGLTWLESSPAFDAVAIDDRGRPVRIVAPDPRAFAAHKLWLSRRADREPVRKRRDEAQARMVARLCVEHFEHLPFAAEELRMLPREVFEAARALFA